jgi:hypothetical protein
LGFGGKAGLRGSSGPLFWKRLIEPPTKLPPSDSSDQICEHQIRDQIWEHAWKSIHSPKMCTTGLTMVPNLCNVARFISLWKQMWSLRVACWQSFGHEDIGGRTRAETLSLLQKRSKMTSHCTYLSKSSLHR